MNRNRIQVGQFFISSILALEKEGRFSTGRNYRRTWDSFSRFLKGRLLYMDEITQKLILSYNQYLLESGLQRNTVSFYNRVLRAVYNRAVKEGYAKQTFPFEAVYTGVDVTRKRALPPQALHTIAHLDLPDPEMALSRDLFLFSFQACGMSFVDMAFLTRQNLQHGFIHYVRRKTEQPLSVRVEPWMQEIMDRYRPLCHSPYLLPILHTSDPRKAFKEYTVALGRHNRMLRKIGEQIGGITISSYSARHSWATIARDAEVPLSVISSGMGHTSEKTTRIYLASLDNSLIDRANRNIWERVVNCFEPQQE